jgi:ketosteroid isomerase-like protein
MKLPQTLHDLPRTLLGFHLSLASYDPQAETLEDRVKVLEVEAAAHRLLNKYAYAYDAGDVEAMMTIYSEDCVLINNKGTFAGAAAIRANYEQAVEERALAFHHLANLEVQSSDERTEAWVTGYLHNLAVRWGKAGGTMATCVFHIRNLGGEWKVVECRIVVSNQHSFGLPDARPAVGTPAVPTGQLTVADLFDEPFQ